MLVLMDDGQGQVKRDSIVADEFGVGVQGKSYVPRSREWNALEVQ